MHLTVDVLVHGKALKASAAFFSDDNTEDLHDNVHRQLSS